MSVIQNTRISLFIETLIRILVETIYNVMTGDSIKTKIIVKIKNWCYSNDFVDFLKTKKKKKKQMKLVIHSSGGCFL